jgi:NAD(P)-dependent dehydrogenase (short-subunit alcohol dehydrogenase family)
LSDRGIAGRVALVTGAARSRSIGRAVARRLAEEGAHVACIDIGRPPTHAPDHGVGSLAELDELVDQLKGLGVPALAVEADVTSVEQMADAVDRVSSELGDITLCCATAGGVGYGNGIAPLVRLSEAEWDWVLDLNLKGAWITATAVARKMIQARTGGRIVTFASAAALPGANGKTGMGAYAAAKAGVISLTQNLAAELARFGITVNAVSPGMVQTQASQPVRDRLQSKGQLDQWIGDIPLGRTADPSEIAAVVAFLFSNDAGYVTGDAINATGGQTLG